MKKAFYLFAWLATFVSAVFTAAQPLPRSTPEEQGISSASILGFVEAADQRVDAMHSFMLLRHGKVVAEGWWSPFNPESRHELYSLSKSFTSTAVGLAASEGKLNIDDPVLKYFPEDAPENPSTNLKAMRIRDLLRMATGHQTEPALRSSNSAPVWTKTFLAHPVPNKPGTHFLYNTAGTYMQSAIVQKATGLTLLDYLRPRLFEPLGIESPTWGTSPQGISLGGYGLNVRTEDIARFGQLYLRKGEWNGKQLIPAAWVSEATSLQTANGSNPQSDWDQGYGYQFWRCRHGIYRGDGAFGQFCIVMPEQDAVLAITSGTKDMQNILNIVWDRLLPSFKASPLAANGSAETQLTERLTNLTLPPQRSSTASEPPSGVSDKKYFFPPNDQNLESIGLAPGNGGVPATLVLQCNGIEQRLACGNGTWIKSHLAYGTEPDRPVAASGAWAEDGVFKAKLCFYETPFVLSVTIKVSGDELAYDSEYNVAFGSAKKTRLTGHTR